MYIYNTARIFPCFSLDSPAVYNVHKHGSAIYTLPV